MPDNFLTKFTCLIRRESNGRKKVTNTSLFFFNAQVQNGFWNQRRKITSHSPKYFMSCKANSCRGSFIFNVSRWYIIRHTNKHKQWVGLPWMSDQPLPIRHTTNTRNQIHTLNEIRNRDPNNRVAPGPQCPILAGFNCFHRKYFPCKNQVKHNCIIASDKELAVGEQTRKHQSGYY